MEGTVKEILNFKVVKLWFTKCVEKGLCRVEKTNENSTKFCICRPIDNAVTGIGEA